MADRQEADAACNRELRADDRAILDALEDGPLSTQEIAEKIRRGLREEWLIDNGIYSESEVDQPSNIVKLLSCGLGRDRGLKLMGHEIDPRLRSLEKRGAVERIQIENHRPMLWRSRV